MNNRTAQKPLNRRRFLHTAAAAGMGLACGACLTGQTPAARAEDAVNVALIGAGNQGQVLMFSAMRIPGVRLKAVCDIWERFNLKRTCGLLRRYGHQPRAYTDYREMLDREEDLDAVIVATPDCWHARHTIACLEAGLNVYCEKEMSNTLDGARRMVRTARKTGKLLQIGRHHRSDPAHIFCREKVLKEAKILGRISVVNGQWNQSPQPPVVRPKKYEIDSAILEAHGYASMHEFLNWRRNKKLGGSPVVDCGSGQIDTYNWYLDARPKSVYAAAQHTAPENDANRWPDTAMVIYDYDTPDGPAKAFYQVVNSNASFKHFEAFLGERGTLITSASPNRVELYRGPLSESKTWAQWVEQGYLREPVDPDELDHFERRIVLPVFTVGETAPPPRLSLPYTMPLPRTGHPWHYPHLKNFFDAIRGKAKLACPAEVGYETAATVLRINEAIEAGRRLSFKPEDFVV